MLVKRRLSDGTLTSDALKDPEDKLKAEMTLWKDNCWYKLQKLQILAVSRNPWDQNNFKEDLLFGQQSFRGKVISVTSEGSRNDITYWRALASNTRNHALQQFQEIHNWPKTTWGSCCWESFQKAFRDDKRTDTEEQNHPLEGLLVVKITKKLRQTAVSGGPEVTENP